MAGPCLSLCHVYASRRPDASEERRLAQFSLLAACVKQACSSWRVSNQPQDKGLQSRSQTKTSAGLRVAESFLPIPAARLRPHPRLTHQTPPCPPEGRPPNIPSTRPSTWVRANSHYSGEPPPPPERMAVKTCLLPCSIRIHFTKLGMCNTEVRPSLLN